VKRWVVYVALSGLAVAASVGAGSFFLNGRQAGGLAVAGGVAWAVQAAVSLLSRLLRRSEKGFLPAMLVGMAGRFGALGVLGVLVTVKDYADAEGPLILGTVTFLFALLLVEARFLEGDPNPLERHESA
jgi:hypothetical protein